MRWPTGAHPIGRASRREELTVRLCDVVTKAAERARTRRVMFFVDGDAKRTGLVHRVLIVDSAGNRNRIDFKAPRFNRNFDAKTFAWQPPKNARKVNP